MGMEAAMWVSGRPTIHPSSARPSIRHPPVRPSSARPFVIRGRARAEPPCEELISDPWEGG